MKAKDITKYALSLLLSLLLWSCSSDTQTESESSGTNTSVSAEELNAADNEQQSSTIHNTASTDQKSITQQAASIPELSEFAKAFESSGLTKDLNSTGPYTVFMPSNKAFEALPGGTLDNLLKPENKQHLRDILNNHIVAGKLDTATLQHGSKIKTLGNEQLEVSKQENLVMINGAEVRRANIQSSNGVIHVIDKVLMPKK